MSARLSKLGPVTYLRSVTVTAGALLVTVALASCAALPTTWVSKAVSDVSYLT